MEESWKKIIEKYNIIKEIFIECEETDPELKTNLQPLNEFRAALDHIIRMMDAYYQIQDEQEWKNQFNKFNSHLDRAFFDICDMVSINYRNKIVDIVVRYDTETIRTAIPQYFTEWRMQIEDISERIAKYRLQKGTRVSNEELFQNYKNDVYKLRKIFKDISHQQLVLEKLAKENREKKTESVRLKYIAYGGFGLAVISLIHSFLK
jgi:hypothetical protein